MQFSIPEKSYICHVISDIYGKANNSNIQVTFDLVSAFKILYKSMNIFKREPSMLEINNSTNESEFVIVGDIHGNIQSLINIFQKNGDPSTTRYLFLGDYVDRGKNSCEVIILLYAFKCLYPKNIYLIRGNHEFRYMNDNYGFKDECYKRIHTETRDNIVYDGSKFYEKVTKSFQFLPIGAILKDKIFCVHGGISGLIENRKELMNIEKVGIMFCSNDSAAAELLWNDPDTGVSTFKKSNRGLGCIFGNKSLDVFLKKMNFDIVIRAHQITMNGYDWPFGRNGGILTIFSCVDYCGSSNDAAVALVSNDGKIRTMKFDFNPTVLLPAQIIENNYAFLDDVLLNPDLNLKDIPCFI